MALLLSIMKARDTYVSFCIILRSFLLFKAPWIDRCCSDVILCSVKGDSEDMFKLLTKHTGPKKRFAQISIAMRVCESTGENKECFAMVIFSLILEIHPYFLLKLKAAVYPGSKAIR